MKSIAIPFLKITLFCLSGLILFFLLFWGLNQAQADVVGEGKKKSSESCYDNIEFYLTKQGLENPNNVKEIRGGELSCTGKAEDGTCECSYDGEIIYWLDKVGNEWHKGNKDIGGDRLRILGGDSDVSAYGDNMTWITNGPGEGEKFYKGDYSKAGDYVMGWYNSGKDNDLHIYDNLIMLNKPHFENWSPEGTVANQFSLKPFKIGAGGTGRFISSGTVVVDQKEKRVIDPPGTAYKIMYQRIEHSSPYLNQPPGNVDIGNDMEFVSGDSFLAGRTHITGDGDNGLVVNGLIFYPWQYYQQDPRNYSSIPGYQNYSNEKYQEKWKKRMMAFDDNGDGLIDRYDATINAFATFIEASDYFGDCSDSGPTTNCIDRMPLYDKSYRYALDYSNQMAPAGDDHVDLRLYLAAGKRQLNRFSIWSYDTPKFLNTDFFNTIFSSADNANTYQIIRHSFYGDGSVYHTGMMDLNLGILSREYIDENNLRNATNGNALLTIWGSTNDIPPMPVVLHEFDDLGMAFHKSGVLFNPLNAPPANPKEGMVYYSAADNQLKYHDGTSWKDIGEDETGSGGIGTNCVYDHANFKDFVECPANYVIVASCVRDASEESSGNNCVAPDGSKAGDQVIKCCPLLNN